MKDIFDYFVEDTSNVKLFDINYFILSHTDDVFRQARVKRCIREGVRMDFPVYSSERQLHDGNHRVGVLKDIGYKEIPIKI